MRTPEQEIATFVRRLEKAGIVISLSGNYPWIYLTKVNGKRVTELFKGNHGFTVAFYPIRPNHNLVWTDLSTIFQLLRRYRDETSVFYLDYPRISSDKLYE